ncbi:MAG TPA: fibronectin type III domain-containing protein [Planctomycetota bacterium]|nr:fibronectin type III domain-containing protein [Planctomycetota bacterium]
MRRARQTAVTPALAVLLLAIGTSATGADREAAWRKSADPPDTTVTDVSMYSPYIPLPVYVSAEATSGAMDLVSGSGAEAVTTFPIRKGETKVWWVWAKLPDDEGGWVFAKGDERVAVRAWQDPQDPTLRRIAVCKEVPGQPPDLEKPTLTIQRRIRIPFQGPVKQVAGPKATLHASGGMTLGAIPDQVCTLVFEDQAGKKRLVVRAWEDKSSRYFVGPQGDDANPGTEERPFRSILHAMDYIRKNDPRKNADVYIAGGDYSLGGEQLCMTDRISVYGGFDEDGWRRDPGVTESVLLPHGFRENWIDDISDRFKDLRRPHHRHFETRIRRDYTKARGDALIIGPNWTAYEPATGTPDTFLDGLTVYGPDRTGAGESALAWSVAHQRRTIRNCIMVGGYANGHCYSMATGGMGLVENNLVVMPIVGRAGNARPQIVGGFGHWHRNLILGATGGGYSRILNLWGNGGIFTENQIHGGSSFGWSGFQAHHSATRATRDHVLRGNLIYMDYLFRPFLATSLIMEGNDISLLKGGVSGLWTSRELIIRNNTFRVPKGFTEKELFPPALVVQKLGGRWENEELVQPQDENARRPTIGGNKYEPLSTTDRRNWNLIDLEKYSRAIQEKGEAACIRPRNPAKDLRATVTGPGTAKLTWDASSDSDVVGYIIRHGPSPNSLLNPTFHGRETTAEVRNLKPGRHYFTVAAHKEGYLECWTLSNEAMVEIKE